eukprot:5281583-Pleurochrysis_carterae.AAC.1
MEREGGKEPCARACVLPPRTKACGCLKRVVCEAPFEAKMSEPVSTRGDLRSFDRYNVADVYKSARKESEWMCEYASECMC